MNPFLLLLGAIVSELAATTALKYSNGLTQLVPSVLMVFGYGVAFYLLSLALKTFPVSTAYAIWSGLGTVGTVAIGIVLWREALDIPRVLGIGLIIAGVIVLNVFSKTVAH